MGKFAKIMVLVALFNPMSAHAYRSIPSFGYFSPPELPGTYSRPSLPICLSDFQFSRTHTCDQWVIDSYVDEVNNYIQKLREFVEEANEFNRNASNYASEALDYAKCESDEVKKDIE